MSSIGPHSTALTVIKEVDELLGQGRVFVQVHDVGHHLGLLDLGRALVAGQHTHVPQLALPELLTGIGLPQTLVPRFLCAVDSKKASTTKEKMMTTVRNR
jgi:hypothetical protein